MMDDDQSIINRTNASGFGNIRDEENDDDDEFFSPVNETDDDADHEDGQSKVNSELSYARVVKDDRSTSGIEKENLPQSQGNNTSAGPSSVFSSQLAQNPSRRLADLSKITEVPEEYSFSFKHGENALKFITEDHEKRKNDVDLLRLHSGSFHASHYSMKHSWEESALRYHNTIARPELDLSVLQIEAKADTSVQLVEEEDLQRQSNKTAISSSRSATHDPIFGSSVLADIQSSQKKQQPSSNALLPAAKSQLPTNCKPFISGTRNLIYFGFRRLGVDSEEEIILHNVHPNRKRIKIRCFMKTSKSKTNSFKQIYPSHKEWRLLEWDFSQKLVIAFMPTDVVHFENFLYVECSDGAETRKYKFLLIGFGGRAIVEPCLENRLGTMHLSTNGRYQLMVKSLMKFHFWLQNRGDRVAFASVHLLGRGGEQLPHQEFIVKNRNVVLDKKGGVADNKKLIEIRIFAKNPKFPSESPVPRPNTVASSRASTTGSATVREAPALQIVIYWGEERQRQRLKQLEKTNTCGDLSIFGQNFTNLVHFEGEPDRSGEELEKRVTAEDFFEFRKSTKMIFIDVHEKCSLERYGKNVYSQPRASTALSTVTSTSSQQELRAHQTIIELDPDNTLVGASPLNNYYDDEDDDDGTLTHI